MAKFFEISDENKELIEDVFNETGLLNYINLKIVGIPKAKELVKISKANPLAEYVGKIPDSIVCTVYEEAFDKLDEKNKKLILEDAFNNVAYDDEKEKILVGVPQIVVTVGGRRKYGDDLINAVEMGVMMIQEVEEDRKAKKEMERVSKSKKNS